MNLSKILAAMATMLLVTQANASAVTPSYTSFGTLAGATFGGTGISNSDVAITSINSGKVTLGLTATQRYSSPAVTSDDNGVFNATSGAYAAGDNLALWNFDYYIGGSGVSSYTYKLLVDFNPAGGNALSSYVDLSYLLTLVDLGIGRQNSLNLGDLLTSASNTFDPSAAGEYGVVLEAFKSSQEVGESAILIDVGGYKTASDVPPANVPEPASLALAGVALAGAVVASRRRKG